MQSYRIQRYTKSIVTADGQTVGQINTATLNGIIRGIIVDVPQLTGTTTTTIALLDQDGGTMFSKASIAENAKTSIYVDGNNYPLQIPVGGIITLKSTQTNAQSGAAATIPVTLLIDRGR